MALRKLLVDKSVRMMVFDMAGTTVNEKGLVYKTLHNTIREFDIPIKDGEIDGWHGVNKYEVLSHFCNRLNESSDYIDTVIPMLNREFETNLIEAYSIPGNLSLIHEDLPFKLKEFQKYGIKVCLNTGYSKKIQEGIIETLNMRDFIDDYISSQDVIKGRPYPFMINKLMKRNNITNPKHVIKVGDTPTDIIEGLHAHCYKSVGVLSGADSEHTLISAGATNIIDSVIDIELL